MTDLVKGVLGSPRSLIIGWILPTFVTVQLIAALIEAYAKLSLKK